MRLMTWRVPSAGPSSVGEIDDDPTDDLRREVSDQHEVGRCRLNLSNPR